MLTYVSKRSRDDKRRRKPHQYLGETKNTKPCGLPGEYILILPDFFTDTTERYGNKGKIKISKSFKKKKWFSFWIAKVMVHEFAHFRYGVFEEYGYPDEREDHEDLFPYAYKQVNSCNNPKIEGKISTLYDYIYFQFCQLYFDFINTSSSFT